MSSGLQILTGTAVSAPTTIIIPPPTGNNLAITGAIAYDQNTKELSVVNSSGDISNISALQLISINGVNGDASISPDHYYSMVSGGSFNVSNFIDGFGLAAHQISIPNATASQAGLVNQSTQTFAGSKTFSGFLSGIFLSSTINDPSNTVSVNTLRTTSAPVIIDPTPPLVGQILMTVSSQTATWQDLPGGTIKSINTLTPDVQFFGVGFTGNDFNIAPDGDTNVFSLPAASSTARGMMNFSSQTIAGNKSFTGNTTLSSVINSVIDSTTNTVAASLIQPNINVSSAAAPTANQILTATSGTTATWQAQPTLVNINTITSGTYPVTVNGSVSGVTGNALTLDTNNNLSNTASWIALPTGNNIRTITSQDYSLSQNLPVVDATYSTFFNNNVSIPVQFSSFGAPYSTVLFDPHAIFSNGTFGTTTISANNGPLNRIVRIELSLSVIPTTSIDLNAIYYFQIINNGSGNNVCQFSGRILSQNRRTQVQGVFEGPYNLNSQFSFQFVAFGGDKLSHTLQLGQINVKFTVLAQ